LLALGSGEMYGIIKIFVSSVFIGTRGGCDFFNRQTTRIAAETRAKETRASAMKRDRTTKKWMKTSKGVPAMINPMFYTDEKR
jgi:hypothetical protein